MEQNNFIITINRESGSGGREIAQKLGDLLGVKVYDKALLDKIAEEFNMTAVELDKAAEKKSNWWADFISFYKQFGNSTEVDFKENVTSKEIFEAEKKVLLGLAEKESCIVVGRAGFHIFKDHPNIVRILLMADYDARVKRVCETMEVAPAEARKFIDQVDATREAFTKTFTGVSRYDARNYDFVLNVTNIPTHLVAVFLAQNIRLKFQKNQ